MMGLLIGSPLKRVLQAIFQGYITHCCFHDCNLSLASAWRRTIIDCILDIYKSVKHYVLTLLQNLVHLVNLPCYSQEKKCSCGLMQDTMIRKRMSYERYYLNLLLVLCHYVGYFTTSLQRNCKAAQLTLSMIDKI